MNGENAGGGKPGSHLHISHSGVFLGHKYGVTGQTDQALTGAAPHAVVERRMAHEADDQQVEASFLDEFHDGLDLVADEHVGLQLDALVTVHGMPRKKLL